MKPKPQVLTTQIYHKRMLPKVNQFGYKLAYIALPLSKLDRLSIWPIFGVNKRALLSFWNRDHGDRSGSDLRLWAKGLLLQSGVAEVEGEILLVTLPRLFGYVFNPVSFWLCFDEQEDLKAVIAQVNNTFGETHSYVCAPLDGSRISSEEIFYANKDFHVSPFYSRDGYYRFRFACEESTMRFHIDYFDQKNNLQLATSIAAKSLTWDRSNFVKGWLYSPLMSVKAITLIHWQALRLLFKSAGYKPKPEQHKWFQTRATERTPFLKQDAALGFSARSTHVSEYH